MLALLIFVLNLLMLQDKLNLNKKGDKNLFKIYNDKTG